MDITTSMDKNTSPNSASHKENIEEETSNQKYKKNNFDFDFKQKQFQNAGHEENISPKIIQIRMIESLAVKIKENYCR